MGKRSKLPVSKTHPHLMDEWDFEKNEIRPEDVTYGSHKKVWWVCRKCDYGWETAIKHRSLVRSGCPACVCIRKVVTDRNNLSITNPELIDEWDFERNTIGPEKVLSGSDMVVWWVCKKENCGYRWKTRINKRALRGRGCPACVNQAVTPQNSLAFKFPEIAKEWDYNKNKFTPEEVTAGSSRKVWWVCSRCGLSWKTFVYNRTSKYCKRGCSKCSSGPVSKASQKWLDTIGIPVNQREVYIKEIGLRVDAFDLLTNTVYEFLGDYWHGNPRNTKYPPEKINGHNKKMFGVLYKEWLARKQVLVDSGYNVVYIWESDFKKQKSIGD